jgi:hypothetical protein
VTGAIGVLCAIGVVGIYALMLAICRAGADEDDARARVFQTMSAERWARDERVRLQRRAFYREARRIQREAARRVRPGGVYPPPPTGPPIGPTPPPP